MKVARTQPPVGYRIPVTRVLAAAARGLATSDARERVEREIAAFCGVRHAVAVSSGKAALTLILRALAANSERRKVIIPAYTCYSLPSAIVKAGLDVVPCDVAASGFDYDYERLAGMLHPDVLCVLSVHLFGVLSDTNRLKSLCAARGIPVVEDAAQAMGARHEPQPAGAAGDAGFFSLGRGKNVTCGGGGVIVTDSEPIARAIGGLVARESAAGFGDDVRGIFLTLALSAFIDPRMYWLPAGLPFLRLGETIYDTGFPVRRLSNAAASLLHGWQEDLNRLTVVRRANGAFYTERLRLGAAAPAAYLRFPVVLPTAAAAERIARHPRARALGISRMYPAPVDQIQELRGRVPGGPFPHAERLARGLITLPTHPLLSAAERSEICSIVNAETSRDESSIAALAS